MKIIKFLTLGIISFVSLAVNAQRHGNGGSYGNNPGNGRSGRSEMITVPKEQYRQPQYVHNNEVKYQRETPKVTVMRSGNNISMNPISYNNHNYYYDRGIYYRSYNNNYVRIAPPVGLRINILPVGYININLGNQMYYYYEGTYYSGIPNNYAVVAPPVGAIVYALPADYEKVEVNGVVYYEYNGVLYQKITFNGERAYQVAGNVN